MIFFVKGVIWFKIGNIDVKDIFIIIRLFLGRLIFNMLVCLNDEICILLCKFFVN